MNPITYRPKSWNAVVGQSRAIKLLETILTHGKLLPRGFVFEGSYGSGKTSTAYLTARALMCLTPSSLGCGYCASCKIVDSKGLDGPDVMDFKEIDGAMYSGVTNARTIAAPDGWGEAPPNIARRRVTLVDEAHRLSQEAWDIFLKPLEQQVDYSSYLFVTTNGNAIPQTVRSRCTRVRFVKVTEESIFGLLMAQASKDKLQHETAALKLIASRSDGSPRNAMEYYGRVAATGKISVEMVEAMIDTTLEKKCDTLWAALTIKNQKLVSKTVDELLTSNTPAEIIEAMVIGYSNAMREPSSDLHTIIRDIYANIPVTTTFFLKWMSVASLPADAVQLFAYELMYLSPRVIKVSPKLEARLEKADAVKVLTPEEELFS